MNNLQLKFSEIKRFLKYKELNYKPVKIDKPEVLNLKNRQSAWVGLELVLFDIITRFQIKTSRCLEIGVEYGYSTSAFAYYFDQVVGVDTFEGDIHSGKRESYFEETKALLSSYSNIALVKSDYKDFTQSNADRYNLIHTDIIHTYQDTYDCGMWAANHSDIALFHDTESFPEVKRAVADIAKQTGKKFFNYRECHGLGIVV